MKNYVNVAAAVVALACVAQPANAAILTGTFGVKVSEGLTNGAGFSVANGNPFSGANTASATFTYTGPINFDNRAQQNTTPPGTLGDLNSTFGFTNASITNYAGSGTVTFGSTQVADYGNVASFLNSSGSSGEMKYGSYYEFSLGYFLAGTTFTVTHDDGAAMYLGGMRVDNTEAGPTGVRTSTFTLASSGNATLRYGRQNGTPSVLTLDAVAAVPEPATWAMMMIGFGMVAGAARYRRKSFKASFA